MNAPRLKHYLVAAGVLLAVGTAGLAIFIYSGVYPIAANRPHRFPTQWIFTTIQEQSVRAGAGEVKAPPLEDPALAAEGVALYEKHCLVCHGAPGIARAIMGRGLNPNPPRLASEAQEWSDPELFWIVANGLKFAGMPAFQPGLNDRQVWATVALMRRLPQMTPEEYALAAAQAGERGDGATGVVAIMTRMDRGPDMPTGDPDQGRALIKGFGCGSCHVIPGVPGALGRVGPPLSGYGEQHYIAGTLLNDETNLARWIAAPQQIEPGTAMPSVGATAEQARHMAAYLLSLGQRTRLGPPHPLPVTWLPKH